MTWQDVSYRASDVGAPAVDLYLRAMRRLYDSGAIIFKCFQPHDDLAFDTAFWNDSKGNEKIETAFLSNPSVQAALPELWQDGLNDRPPRWEHMSAFAMEGELTHLLRAGGAYFRFDGTVDQARQLSREFMEAFLGDNYLSVAVALTYSPWTGWFHDIAWDRTFVVFDRSRRRFWLLCLTDTD